MAVSWQNDEQMHNYPFEDAYKHIFPEATQDLSQSYYAMKWESV